MKLTYRPEIDGLRAIAVFSVILFHSSFTINGVNIFAGGYIGVDIFFVISGYLITSLILKELNLTGKFSFTYFYERRARRILPSLIIVLFFSYIFTFNFFFPQHFLEFIKSLISALSFISNIYFYISNFDYWDDQLLQPILHTWSLAVEEQFYIIFPFILILIYKYFRNYFLLIFAISLFVSLIIADFASGNNKLSGLSFYSLPTRGWELLAGSILAQLEIKFKNNKKNKFINILAPLGVILILFYFLYSIKILNSDIDLIHPSFITLPPIVGTMLIIRYSSKNNIITKILSTKVFVNLGLISYSLYLWHYPIFIFGENLGFMKNSILENVLLIAFSLILSAITYKYIEKPFRNKNKVSISKLIVSLLFSFLLLLSLAFHAVYKDGYKNRYEKIYNNIYGSELTVLKKISGFDLNKSYYSDEWNLYNKKLGIPLYSDDTKHNILIVGNSHAYDFFHIIKMNKSLQNVYEPTIWRPFPNDKKKDITDFYNFLSNKLIVEDKFKEIFKESQTIVFSTRYTDQDIDKLDQVFKMLKEKNKNILILTNTPEFPTELKNKKIFTIIDNFVFKNKRIPNKIENLNLQKKYYNERNKIKDRNVDQKNKILKRITKENNISLIDLNNYLCNEEEKKCNFLTDKKKKIVFDYGHYSLEGAVYMGNKMSNEILRKIK